MYFEAYNQHSTDSTNGFPCTILCTIQSRQIRKSFTGNDKQTSGSDMVVTIEVLNEAHSLHLYWSEHIIFAMLRHFSQAARHTSRPLSSPRRTTQTLNKRIVNVK